MKPEKIELTCESCGAEVEIDAAKFDATPETALTLKDEGGHAITVPIKRVDGWEFGLDDRCAMCPACIKT